LLMGATDDLPRLADALHKNKHPDVWDAAVITLRHWIGRAPGQDQVLYKGMLARGVKPVNAATLMQLWHSFGRDELAAPDRLAATCLPRKIDWCSDPGGERWTNCGRHGGWRTSSRPRTCPTTTRASSAAAWPTTTTARTSSPGVGRA